VAAGEDGLFDSLYTETGVDGREFWPISNDTVLAAHVALRYLLSANNAPFWAPSSEGGAVSEIGGEQPLRGFGGPRALPTVMAFQRRSNCGTGCGRLTP
jgi:hypothetical protein